MSPVVRIPDETFLRLQRLATPLVDSVGDVIARLLDEHDLKSVNSAEINQGHMMTTPHEVMPVANSLQPTPLATAGFKHPNYLLAPPATQRLHDKVGDLIDSNFGSERLVEQQTLVFRKNNRNFAAIQRLGIRAPVLDLSIFGELHLFADPAGLLTRGRFEEYSKLRISESTDMSEVLSILKQSFSIRMNRPTRKGH